MPGAVDLPRDNRNVRIDVRGERDLTYSQWHRRTLASNAYVTDVDFVEYRFEREKLVLKGIFETKEWHVTDPKYIENNANFKAVKTLSEVSGLPFYCVWYHLDGRKQIDRFKLWEVLKEEKISAKTFTPMDMKKFLESL
jgi:hypothetical protein